MIGATTYHPNSRRYNTWSKAVYQRLVIPYDKGMNVLRDELDVDAYAQRFCPRVANYYKKGVRGFVQTYGFISEKFLKSRRATTSFISKNCPSLPKFADQLISRNGNNLRNTLLHLIDTSSFKYLVAKYMLIAYYRYDTKAFDKNVNQKCREIKSFANLICDNIKWYYSLNDKKLKIFMDTICRVSMFVIKDYIVLPIYNTAYVVLCTRIGWLETLLKTWAYNTIIPVWGPKWIPFNEEIQREDTYTKLIDGILHYSQPNYLTIFQIKFKVNYAKIILSNKNPSSYKLLAFCLINKVLWFLVQASKLRIRSCLIAIDPRLNIDYVVRMLVIITAKAVLKKSVEDSLICFCHLTGVNYLMKKIDYMLKHCHSAFTIYNYIFIICTLYCYYLPIEALINN